MLKKVIYFVSILCFINTTAQVGIGTVAPDASSALDISSKTSGILIPRMTTVERDLITSPANGLIVFNTDSDELQYNSNSPITPIWQAFASTPTSISNIGQSVKYSNVDITTNVNVDPAINAPLLGTQEWNDNTTLYTVNLLTNEITINETGRYKIIVNIPLSTEDVRDRMAPEMRITINDTPVGSYGSTGYIRTHSDHQESSLHITEVLEINNGERVAVEIQEAANVSNDTNTVEIREAGSASIYIEKLM